MALVAFAISLFVAALGVLGIFSPPQLVDVVRHFQTPAGLYAAAALRLNQTTQDWYTSSGADVGATPVVALGLGRHGGLPLQNTHPLACTNALWFDLVLGAALFFAAPTSRAPEVVRIVGVIVFVTGLITPHVKPS